MGGRDFELLDLRLLASRLVHFVLGPIHHTSRVSERACVSQHPGGRAPHVAAGAKAHANGRHAKLQQKAPTPHMDANDSRGASELFSTTGRC